MKLTHCPFCNSEDIAPERSRREMAWGILLLGFPLLAKKLYRCFDCGKIFDSNGKERQYN